MTLDEKVEVVEVNPYQSPAGSDDIEPSRLEELGKHLFLCGASFSAGLLYKESLPLAILTYVPLIYSGSSIGHQKKISDYLRKIIAPAQLPFFYVAGTMIRNMFEKSLRN
jgi:hypothetical protein